MPSAKIPQVWGEFLRGGSAQPLKAIAQHNLLDVLSLSALLSIVATTYAQPGYEHANAFGIARALKRRGDKALSLSRLQQSYRALDPRAQMELASLHRRRGEWAPTVKSGTRSRTTVILRRH